MFRNQTDLQEAEDRLLLNTSDVDLQTYQRLAEQALTTSISAVDAVEIKTLDLFTDFKTVKETTFRRLNMYYAQYGVEYTLENLSWSNEHILNTCGDPLRDETRERLLGVSELESGGPLVFKLMLDVVMDVEDSSLRSLVQLLQSLKLKDIEGENIATIVSY